MKSSKQAVIYSRVSSEDQNCARQIAELTAYAERAGYTVAGVFQEKASGAKNDRAERQKIMLLARQRKIDAILVTEISRWGRSTEDLLSTLQQLSDWNVSVIAQTGMQFDLSSPQGKLMVTMLAGFSEFERALITERVRSGVKAALAKGVKFGRDPLDAQKAKRVADLLDQGHSVRSIAAAVGVSPTTVMKLKTNRKAAS